MPPSVLANLAQCGQHKQVPRGFLATFLGAAHLKFSPPGAPYFAPNPAVIHTGDLRYGINFLTFG